MRFIDMHLHTTASDGSCTPSEVCQLAIDRNLAAIAITDHDTVDGVADAITYADNWNSTLPPIQNSDSTNCSGFSDSSDHHIEVDVRHLQRCGDPHSWLLYGLQEP